MLRDDTNQILPFTTAPISAGRPLTSHASSAAMTQRTQLKNIMFSMPCSSGLWSSPLCIKKKYSPDRVKSYPPTEGVRGKEIPVQELLHLEGLNSMCSNHFVLPSSAERRNSFYFSNCLPCPYIQGFTTSRKSNANF